MVDGQVWYATLALEALLNHIKNNTNKIHLLDSYSPGQDYATVVGNSIGEADVVIGDFTGPSPNGNHRRLTFNGKSGNATGNSATGELHLALTSGSEVLAVTDETTNQAITNGNPLTFPSFYMQASQPDLVI